MCGIAGIVAEGAPRYEPILDSMLHSLRHRGPDGTGKKLFSKAALGHARLSIVDIEGGAQPMLSQDRAVVVTFNGEIYGYRDIKAELSTYRFRTASDTEIILALYDSYHERFLEFLPGMFAFSLWDERKQELICARDRFGEKPFYYAFGDEGEFIFASEIKALLATKLFTPKLDQQAVTQYLQHLYVHPTRTIYSNVHTLPPAHRLHYRDGRLTIDRYWSLPPAQPSMGLADSVHEFRRLFDKAVSNQLVADVPVGAFLSGGLDSTSVVASASRYKSQLQTFSFGFNKSFNELPYARAVAKKFGTDHVELIDSDTDIADTLIAMQSVYDEPFADSSNIPTYVIAKRARQYCKVVLTGDGGDELLGGYTYWYQPLLHAQQLMKPKLLLGQMLRIANRLRRFAGIEQSQALLNRIQGYRLRTVWNNVRDAHCAQTRYFEPYEIENFGLTLEPGKTPVANAGFGGVDEALRMDIADYLPGDILVKIDRASMAHGLELRAPFLDKDLASFCISLPANFKLNTRQDKIILRKTFEEEWPAEVRTRSKQGFGAPIDIWLQRDSMAALKDHYLNDPRHKIFSLLPFNATRSIVKRNSYQTWILLVLSLWMDQHDFVF